MGVFCGGWREGTVGLEERSEESALGEAARKVWGERGAVLEETRLGWSGRTPGICQPV